MNRWRISYRNWNGDRFVRCEQGNTEQDAMNAVPHAIWVTMAEVLSIVRD